MRLLFPFLSLSFLLSTPSLGAIDLVRDGKAVATVVVPDKAFPCVALAAKELVHHIERSTGAKLQIFKESQKPEQGPLLFVGACLATAEAEIDTEEFPANGFLLKVVGDRFFLVGDDSEGQPAWILHGNRTRVGTLFAVYEFLEKHLQVRWLWPGELGEVIPHHKNIVVDTWDQAGEPAFLHTRWRDGGNFYAGAQGWASGKTRSQFLNEQGKWLRRNRFAMGQNMDMAHAFTKWWERHKDDHPDFFNLLPDGTRRPDPNYYGGASHLVSMCVSNPDFHKAIVEDWQKTRSPTKPNIDASENDTSGCCTCPHCMAWDVADPQLKAPWDERLQLAKKAFAENDRRWTLSLGSLSDRYARYCLAVQKEAEKIDPQATVMGYAYANYVNAPIQTKLNKRIIIGVVPPMYFPWTDEIRNANRKRWDGWHRAGSRLFLRPNWMLDGHNMPMFVAKKLGDDFSYLANHSLIGTDFDSLTGQYATQGPNLYMLARLHARPKMAVDDVLDEYYSAFGKAKDEVIAYFDHWEQVCDAVTERPEGLHWASFYKQAHHIFTPSAMDQGRLLLEKAESAARGEPMAEKRVSFLQKGLRNAQLTLAAQAAYQGYRDGKGLQKYRAAILELDTYRQSVETDLICNMAYLSWAESRTWDRKLLQTMKVPGQQLSDPWKFQWDPKTQGVRGKWFADNADTSQWLEISTDGPWEKQPVGKQWREKHGEDYQGYAWYRTTFELKLDAAKPLVKLVFGAVDEACVIWVNGKRMLRRSSPSEGDTDSSPQAFDLDISEVVRYDRPNSVAVRVENSTGRGGIWRPVRLLSEAPFRPKRSAIKNGGFERQPVEWGKSTMCGQFVFELDKNNPHSGNVCAKLQCKKLGGADAKGKFKTKAWARWFQSVPVDKSKTYTMRLWVKTDKAFAGNVGIWVTGDAKGKTIMFKVLNTDGLWYEVVAKGIVPKGDKVGIYLNVKDGIGTAWFDDVELFPEEEAKSKVLIVDPQSQK